MDVRLDGVTEREVLARIESGLTQGRGGWVVTPNLDILRQLHRNPAERELISGADLVVADGMPIVWASRLQGTPLPQRVAGSDLTWSVAGLAARRSASVFLLGGSPGAAEGAARRLRERHPAIEVVGTLCPPMGFERDADDVGRIVAAVAEASPRVVLVALGYPKQERLIRELQRAHSEAWYLGVGISLSFAAGTVRRAPPWMQRTGLEWIHRIMQEPRRLAGRYLVRGLPFAIQMFAAAAAKRIRSC